MKDYIKHHIKSYKRTYQSLLSFGMMFCLIWIVEPHNLLEDINDAPYELIIPWSICYEILVVVLWSGGALAMLSPYKTINFRELILNSFKLQALTLIMPGRIGDISLIYFLRKKLKKAIVASFLIVDKVLTLLVTGVVASFGIAYFYNPLYALIFLTLILLVLITLKILISAKPSSNLLSSISFINNIYRDYLKGIRINLSEMSNDYKNIVINLLFTLSRSILAGISFTIILYWYGADVSLWFVIMIQAMAQIIAIIPITYMGIGLVESINIYFLGDLGVDISLVLAASLATRAIQVLFYLLVTFIWLRPRMKRLE